MRTLTHRLLPLLPLLATLACERAPERVAPEPLFDPQLTAIDHATPSTRFDGGAGSIVLGRGWTPPEVGQLATRRPVAFAWAIDGESTILAPRPPAAEVDLWGLAFPFRFEGAPPQTVTVTRGGRELGTATLAEEGWQELRIPLPAEALAPGRNRLSLSFGYARRPAEVIPGREDRRRLAAAFRALALVPRELPEPERFLDRTELDAAARRLRLPVGASATLPLPADRELVFRLGEVSSSCRGCRLWIELLTADGAGELWRGEPPAASGRSLELATPAGPPSRLRLTVVATDGEPFDAGRRVEIELPPNAVERRRERGQGEPPTHVFVYLIDTLRADVLAPYGGPPELSPRTAELAADAVVYRRAWSASSWTLPSVVSILTGVYPHRHGIMRGEVRFTGDPHPPLATLLGAAGYDTLAISQSLVASHRFGVDTGFDRFLFSNQLNGYQLRSQDVRRPLLDHLLHRRHPERPLFAYLHTVDPHAPYAPTGRDRRFAEERPGRLPDSQYRPSTFMIEELGEDPAEVDHLRALYQGEVAHADRQLGRFLDMLRHLDLYDGSLVVVLSDHGEEFGEHGGFDHGRTVYEEMVRVPLIVKYPHGRWAGTVVDRRVSTVDLVPSILRAVGADAGGAAFDGESLLPSDLRDRRADGAPRIVFSEVSPARARHLEAVDYRTLARGEVKCIESRTGIDQLGREVPPWRTFRLDLDPGESRPLDPASPRARRCRETLEQWLELQELGPRGLSTAEETDPETLDKLRALGYIE
jgi:arylsulfatase A-like enzyme